MMKRTYRTIPQHQRAAPKHTASAGEELAWYDKSLTDVGYQSGIRQSSASPVRSQNKCEGIRVKTGEGAAGSLRHALLARDG